MEEMRRRSKLEWKKDGGTIGKKRATNLNINSFLYIFSFKGKKVGNYKIFLQ